MGTFCCNSTIKTNIKAKSEELLLLLIERSQLNSITFEEYIYIIEKYNPYREDNYPSFVKANFLKIESFNRKTLDPIYFELLQAELLDNHIFECKHLDYIRKTDIIYNLISGKKKIHGFDPDKLKKKLYYSLANVYSSFKPVFNNNQLFDKNISNFKSNFKDNSSKSVKLNIDYDNIYYSSPETNNKKITRKNSDLFTERYKLLKKEDNLSFNLLRSLFYNCGGYGNNYQYNLSILFFSFINKFNLFPIEITRMLTYIVCVFGNKDYNIYKYNKDKRLTPKHISNSKVNDIFSEVKNNKLSNQSLNNINKIKVQNKQSKLNLNKQFLSQNIKKKLSNLRDKVVNNSTKLEITDNNKNKSVKNMLNSEISNVELLKIINSSQHIHHTNRHDFKSKFIDNLKDYDIQQNKNMNNLNFISYKVVKSVSNSIKKVSNNSIYYENSNKDSFISDSSSSKHNEINDNNKKYNNNNLKNNNVLKVKTSNISEEIIIKTNANKLKFDKDLSNYKYSNKKLVKFKKNKQLENDFNTEYLTDNLVVAKKNNELALNSITKEKNKSKFDNIKINNQGNNIKSNNLNIGKVFKEHVSKSSKKINHIIEKPKKSNKKIEYIILNNNCKSNRNSIMYNGLKSEYFMKSKIIYRQTNENIFYTNYNEFVNNLDLSKDIDLDKLWNFIENYIKFNIYDVTVTYYNVVNHNNFYEYAHITIDNITINEEFHDEFKSFYDVYIDEEQLKSYVNYIKKKLRNSILYTNSLKFYNKSKDHKSNKKCLNKDSNKILRRYSYNLENSKERNNLITLEHVIRFVENNLYLFNFVTLREDYIRYCSERKYNKTDQEQ